VTATDSLGDTASQTVDYTVVPVSPTSFVFAPQFLGTASPWQIVTVTNTQTSPAIISGITTSGDFQRASGCPRLLGAQRSCRILVRFVPKSVGTLAGSLTLSEGGTPMAVSLTGIGTQVRLSPRKLNFLSRVMGTMSGIRKVTLVNRQNTPLDISGITISGDYVESDNCGSQLPALSNCQISLAFAPNGAGSRPGTLTVNAAAPTDPPAVPLAARGIPPVFASPAAVAFGYWKIPALTGIKKITVTSRLGQNLTITGLVLGGANPGDFVLPASPFSCAKNQCAIWVRFDPLASGGKTATLAIYDSPDPMSPQIVTLTGNGL